ncbi:MAG TPA: alpha/beta fold hydrolase [Rhodothermales bacterium]|nr:alpha/beta fold hydrolase [Rhodothermales bacterium]
MSGSSIQVRKASDYQYIDEGPRTASVPVVLLHGMLGDLSNWTDSVHALAASGYRVLVPVLPIYDLPLTMTSVGGLVEYVRGFLLQLGVGPAVLVGNSLGGHVALIYALRYPESIPAMILSGASGIYEVNIGSSTPRRQDRNFIRERAAVTFYDPVHVTEELVEDMFAIVNNRSRVMRLIKMARSTKSDTVTEHLESITTPTLLVWGQDDLITPPVVGYEFLERLPNATLYFLERCGHAPMIERPEEFNELMLDFLAGAIAVSEDTEAEERSAR